ncbi:MAG: hypothetical protein KAX24_01490 [Anaerolineae bacterium]|nr:hypothetical protein [Anaerolineae bacterium]
MRRESAGWFIVHCLSRIWLNLPLVDQSHNQGGYAWGQYVLSPLLASGSAVLADACRRRDGTGGERPRRREKVRDPWPLIIY